MVGRERRDGRAAPGSAGAAAFGRAGRRLDASPCRGPTYRVGHAEPTVCPATRSNGLTAEIVACRACPRLVAWRAAGGGRQAGRLPGRGVLGPARCPGFGDPTARLLVVGLAPAAHGGNRTGRVFTGDRSGDWLFARPVAGRVRQPAHQHVAADDGLGPDRVLRLGRGALRPAGQQADARRTGPLPSLPGPGARPARRPPGRRRRSASSPTTCCAGLLGVGPDPASATWPRHRRAGGRPGR